MRPSPHGPHHCYRGCCRGISDWMGFHHTEQRAAHLSVRMVTARVLIFMQCCSARCQVTQNTAGFFRIARVNTSSVGRRRTVPLMRIVRSQTGTEPRLCVETRMIWPSVAKVRIRAMICSSVWTSTPVKGSSRRIHRFSGSARARSTRCAGRRKARRSGLPRSCRRVRAPRQRRHDRPCVAAATCPYGRNAPSSRHLQQAQGNPVDIFCLRNMAARLRARACPQADRGC